MNNEQFYFSGNESLIICPFVHEIYNNFTYEIIIKPMAKHQIDEESLHGTSGISGKKYAIGPGGTSDPSRAGIGVSIGTNGISIYEHSVNHLPAVLVLKANLTNEIHVAIVYQQKIPYLFVNGTLVKKGKRSKQKYVHPSIIIGGLHPYGFFSGEIKDIRIWNHARTVEQIRSFSNQQLGGQENGLYFHYNCPQQPLFLQFKKTNINVSIIIPSYNKYPENTFTLQSLANQNYDLSKVEVIFVDDGSTDATATFIDPMNYPFTMKYVRLKNNTNRPHSRNIALNYAIGDTIIFLDAETLVPKHFIQEHLNARQQNSNVVVSAVLNQKGVYTVFNPSFSEEQKKQCIQLMQKANFSAETIQRITSSNVKTPIISYEDIKIEKYKQLSFIKPHELYYEKQLLAPFGTNFRNFHMPWMSFYTGNCSVSRHLLQKTGVFEEERFKGYGWEDTELGYRLYQVGATFRHHKNIITFHQEHPIHPSVQTDAKKNAYLFFDMYQSDFSALIIALLVAGHESKYTKLNSIVSEYKQLEQDFNESFYTFKHGVKQLLLALGYVNAKDQSIQNIVSVSNLGADETRFSQFKQEMNLLQKTKKYPLLIEMCHRLLQL
ncbi:glycosyltransferase [Pueribacillus sp. YX66]|uniref:glycosyltransferase n=1 Tax=Pueribacillus sp. YX66 TaxID=3229242 RepID=UPI00358D248D